MLVTFSCDSYENITMFGDVAKRLITLMGHSATVPGAIVAKDVPEALSNLQNGIDRAKSNQAPADNKDTDDDEPPISLAHRAIPLIEMLKSASKNQCNVMWK